jgi:hypothetical protein
MSNDLLGRARLVMMVLFAFRLIMGAGKTSVIAPLVCLMLGDGKTLVAEVVPPALLEFSRSVLRQSFGTIMRKVASTFPSVSTSDFVAS